eukprot:jgi/Mesvir1/21330/Mv10017-RA.1
MSSTKTIDRLEVNKSIIFPDRTTLSSTNPFQLGQLAEFVTAWNDDLGVEWLECRVFDPNRKAHELFFAIWEDDTYEYQWDFTTSAASIVGTPVKTFSKGTVEGGVLKVSGGVYYSEVQGLPFDTFTLCMRVIPQQDLSARPPAGVVKDLIRYGFADVKVTDDGHLTVYDGNDDYLTDAMVGLDPFHLAITNQGRTLKVYKDGTLILTTDNSYVGDGILGLGWGREGESVWYDDVRVIAGVAISDRNTLLGA